MSVSNELCTKIKFAELVRRWELISKDTVSRDRKKEILTNFFAEIGRLQQKLIAEGGTVQEASSYPFLRLFLPDYDDNERKAYGIQKVTLGNYYVKALGLNEKSVTARQFTNPIGIDDYSEVIFNAMKGRALDGEQLSVYDVNNFLDLIAENNNKEGRNKIEGYFFDLQRKMSATEQKWLVRLLLKKMKCGLSGREILNIYDENAMDIYNKRSFLSDVCEIIDSKTPLDQVDMIEVFKPIRPMLCERGYIAQIENMLNLHKYYMDTKMDGERCHLHVMGNDIKYFSRRCKEINFGSNNQTQADFSKIFRECLNRSVKSAIFDGEIMAYDRITGIFMKKAEKSTAKYLQSNDPRYNICYVIYDLIYVNGKSIIDIPYAERIRKIGSIVTVKQCAVMLCEYEKIRDVTHFLQLFNKAFDSQEEGIVIKQEYSTYKPGQREKGGWYKFKPDYETNLLNDFDFLIIGVFYNRSKTSVDSYLLGVMEKGMNDSNDSAVFHSVCKIRNGFSREDFEAINKKIEPYKHEVDKSRRKMMTDPRGLKLAFANPDFWVEPQFSVVIQIKASELTKTTTYATGYSLRFPRVVAIRWDKPWYDTETLSTFNTICSSGSNVVKINKRHATVNDVTGAAVPKRRKDTKQEKKAAVNNQSSFASTTTVKIDTVDQICAGLEFHIMEHVCKNNMERYKEMKNMVERHGGKVVDVPSNKTYVIIMSKPNTLRAKQYIEKGLWNIAKPEWFFRAFGSNDPQTKLIDFTPNDMIFATDALKSKFDTEITGDDDVLETTPLLDQNSNNTTNEVCHDILKGLKLTHSPQSICGNRPQEQPPQVIIEVDEVECIEPTTSADLPKSSNKSDYRTVSENPPHEIEESQQHKDIYSMDTQAWMPEELPNDLANSAHVEDNNDNRTILENAPNATNEMMDYEHMFPVNSETIQSNINEDLPGLPTNSNLEDPLNVVNAPNLNVKNTPNAMDPESIKQISTQCQDDTNTFDSCVAYFYQDESSSYDSNVILAQCLLIGLGGTSLETAEEIRASESRLTHIFVASPQFDRNQLKQTVESFGTESLKNIKVLQYQWIIDCDKEQKKICDTNYIVSL